jgi:hypothetical protein
VAVVVSELVNGNNSLVLDGDGNIVLEGTPSGNAINRGLVWDYGANANGVNSTTSPRQWWFNQFVLGLKTVVVLMDIQHQLASSLIKMQPQRLGNLMVKVT